MHYLMTLAHPSYSPFAPTYAEQSQESAPAFVIHPYADDAAFDVRPPLYHGLEGILGITSDEDDLNDSRRCFNCGSPDHSVTVCPEPKNHALIALSRQMFNFYQTSDGGTRHYGLASLQATREWRQQRLAWVDEFSPGQVKQAELRDALGLAILIDIEYDDQEDPPWLQNMAYWGYPPGWAGQWDPKDVMRDRIANPTENDEDADMEDVPFMIFGDEEEPERLSLMQPVMAFVSNERDEQVYGGDSDASQSSGRSSGSDSESDDEAEDPLATDLASSLLPAPLHASPDDGPTKSARRWAKYPETRFSSERLPIYNGTALPPLSLPPDPGWRFPGMLSYDEMVAWSRPCFDRQKLWAQIVSGNFVDHRHPHAFVDKSPTGVAPIPPVVPPPPLPSNPPPPLPSKPPPPLPSKPPPPLPSEPHPPTALPPAPLPAAPPPPLPSEPPPPLSPVPLHLPSMAIPSPTVKLLANTLAVTETNGLELVVLSEKDESDMDLSDAE